MHAAGNEQKEKELKKGCQKQKEKKSSKQKTPVLITHSTKKKTAILSGLKYMYDT